ncbi:MAG: DUF3859 domain-containing protein [Leptolyngbya sp. ERB_1_1]
MANLTQAQFAQIAAEVDRLSQQDDVELDDEQVQQILQNLDLPDDLLEDAIAQLHQRRSRIQEQQRHRIVISTIAIMIFGLLTTMAVVYQKQQNRIAQIAAIQDSLTSQKSAKPVTQFDRQKDSQIFYRVTLKNVPINDRLMIRCRWSDSTNQIVHQSRNQTQEITRSPWTTACSTPLTAQSQAGTWSVKMSVEERPISDQTFIVK